MNAIRLFKGEDVPSGGVECPPEPLPVEAFGWLYREWVGLLRRHIEARDRAEAEPEGSPARAARMNAVGLLEHDLKQFRAETVAGMKLALGWLSQDEPATVYSAFAVAAQDWRDRDQHERRIEELRGEVLRMKHENDQIRRALRVLLAELGYEEGGA